MRKLIALLLSTGLLVGCTSTTEVAEDTSATQDNQAVQADDAQSPEPEPMPTFELSTLGADPDLCKFEDVSNQMNSWQPWMNFTYFPNRQTSPYRLPNVGDINMALVLVDWEDMSGTPDDDSYYLRQVQEMTDWFSLVSQGKLTLNWRISEGWSTLPGSWLDYKRGDGSQYSDDGDPKANQELLNTIVEATDENFDYSGIDYVIFAIPRSGNLTVNGQEIGDVVFYTGMHGFAAFIHPNPDPLMTVVVTDEGDIGNWALGGTTFQGAESHSPSWVFWAHEMGHMLGYISHLAQPGVEDWGGDSAYFVNPMSGGGLFANQWVNVRTVSAWTSWVAGWLDDNQVQCVESGDIDDEVFAINNSRVIDGETKAVIIKTGETSGLVIESREWDPELDPITSKAEAGFYDGIFMYYIDSSKFISDDSLIPLMPNGTDEIWDEEMWPGTATAMVDSWFQEGESATYEGLRIEVLSMQDSVDFVRVSRVEE